MPFSTITPNRLDELCRNGQSINLIDVRTPAEYREVHVGIAKNMPLDRLDANAIAVQSGGLAMPLYVICKSGGRSRQACEKFATAGFTNVFSVEGGTSAWEQSGFAVVRGQKTISLERQVRISAGLLVLLGAGLSYVNPLWITLSAFVGAGLVFSGITDTCGMGLILAKMPWNQVPKTNQTSVPSGIAERQAPKTVCSLTSPKG